MNSRPKQSAEGQRSFKGTPHLFQPYEILFSGFSNSGKTSLISNLVRILSRKYLIGYVKHAAHSFGMDHEGKDTDRVRRSGAKTVFISSPDQAALLSAGTFDFVRQRSMVSDCELLLVEGHKDIPGRRILLIDRSARVLEAHRVNGFDDVLAFVGPRENPAPDLLPHHVPYFHRDRIDAIADFVEELIKVETEKVPLCGLVLAGGYSTRMKKDKALLTYHGSTQVEATFDLVSDLCDRTFVSCRKGQLETGRVSRLPQIHDRLIDFGPVGGLLSAMVEYPKSAWLVVACDLPYLDKDTVAALVSNRRPLKFATVYDSALDGLPEPLCAIYEPGMRQKMFESLGWGHESLRKVLLNSNVKRLKPARDLALENVNDLTEYRKATNYFQTALRCGRVQSGKVN
ncbi:MAG TPA: bifunctional molybdenum cofactor guanylyltransferase MobA/molybdopterin-guanine dinucleotide biosynthesis adaptor protein MobB [Acidobacteriota bacterium]|nr:bifunctional molybdenum cofactor guanylyltransferase MobA/molybdopterin-guanine dinucleotide biosynthesis adaptor protein MobB [Acidobacteriota bacterium]